MLYHLLDFGTAVLAILLHGHGLLLCQIAQITSGIPHLLHCLLCCAFHLTGCLLNPISYLLGILLDVFRCWERATQVLPALPQETLRLFSTHKKDDRAGNRTSSDSYEESRDNTVHASISFLL